MWLGVVIVSTFYLFLHTIVSVIIFRNTQLYVVV